MSSDPTPGPVVQLRSAPRQVTGPLLACVVFTILGVVAVDSDGIGPLVGWLALTVFGLVGLPVTLWQLVRRPVLVQLDPVGITPNRGTTIPWADIRGVTVSTEPVGRTAVVVVELTADARDRSSSGGRAAAARADAALLGPGRVPLPTGTPGGPTGLRDTIDGYRAAHVTPPGA